MLYLYYIILLCSSDNYVFNDVIYIFLILFYFLYCADYLVNVTLNAYNSAIFWCNTLIACAADDYFLGLENENVWLCISLLSTDLLCWVWWL